MGNILPWRSTKTRPAATAAGVPAAPPAAASTSSTTPSTRPPTATGVPAAPPAAASVTVSVAMPVESAPGSIIVSPSPLGIQSLDCDAALLLTSPSKGGSPISQDVNPLRDHPKIDFLGPWAILENVNGAVDFTITESSQTIRDQNGTILFDITRQSVNGLPYQGKFNACRALLTCRLNFSNLCVGNTEVAMGKSVPLNHGNLIQVQKTGQQLCRFIFTKPINKEGVFELCKGDPVRYTVCWNQGPIARGEISEVWPTLDSKGNSLATKVISLPRYSNYLLRHTKEHTNDSTAQLQENFALEHFTRESDVLTKLRDCRTIPQITASFQPHNDAAHYLVMERVPGNTLQSLVAGKFQFTETQMAKIIWDILVALSHLKQFSFCHRNIHPSNVIVHGLPDCPGAHLVGFSHTVEFQEADEEAVPCGTEGFTAPELRPELKDSLERVYAKTGEQLSKKKSDVWSVGALLLFMITGAPPAYATPPAANLSVSAECAQLLQEMLFLDPKDRIGVTTAMGSSWLRDVYNEEDMEIPLRKRRRHPSSETSRRVVPPQAQIPRTNSYIVKPPTPVTQGTPTYPPSTSTSTSTND
ncbi:Protein kinase domain [Pelomyxa schiedti]|nr:Protein kinase domain [Pelomyxa schiedti]